MLFLDKYKKIKKIANASIILLAVSLPLAIKFVVMFFEISNFKNISSQTLIYFTASTLGFLVWFALLMGIALYHLHQYGKSHYLKKHRSSKNENNDNPEFEARANIRIIMNQTPAMAVMEEFKKVALSTSYTIFGLGYFLFNILKYPVIILGLSIILLSIIAAILKLFQETGIHLPIFEIQMVSEVMKYSGIVWGLIISALAISGFYFMTQE